MLWLLVVGVQVQGSRLRVRDEGSCSSSFPLLPTTTAFSEEEQTPILESQSMT